MPRVMVRWLSALSAYSFATSFKWFILLAVVLPTQVERIVPAGEKNSAWGMVFGLGAIWAVFGPSIFGYWSDRLGTRRRFIYWGGALTIFALIVLATATSLLQLALGYLLLQVSDDVGTGPYDALIADLVPRRLRGLGSGFMNVASLTGQITVGVAAILLRENVVAVYGLIGAVTLIGVALSASALHNRERGELQGIQEGFFKGLLKGWLAPWKHKDFFWVWFSRFLFSLGLYLVQPYLKFYVGDSTHDYVILGQNLGSSAAATSLLILTISLTGALSAIYGGAASDRYGRKRIIYASGLIMSALLVPFLLTRSLLVLWLLSAVFGIGFGAYLSAAMAMAVDALPSRQTHGKDMGIWQMSISSVQILAGSAGLLVDYGNQARPLMGYQIVFGLASFIFVLGTLVVSRVKGVAVS